MMYLRLGISLIALNFIFFGCLFQSAGALQDDRKMLSQTSCGRDLSGIDGQVFQAEATAYVIFRFFIYRLILFVFQADSIGWKYMQNFLRFLVKKGANWPTGNCLFERWPQPQGLGSIAIASNLWNSARVCGACLSITAPSGKVHQAIVSDQCASCKANGLDLSLELWKQVSDNQNPGVLNITWKMVSCNFSTPIKFINKIGTSSDFTSVQVAGSNRPISSLEILPAGSQSGGSIGNKSWIKLSRQSNSNYFQPSSSQGFGTRGDLRVTCDNGKQIITRDILLDRPFNTTDAEGNCP